jgi:8-oxo-dGTP diphosphatase
MKLLATLFRKEGLNLEGKIASRQAARAIIFQRGKLLLVHLTRRGDYSFPGGGVEAGETHSAALARELREECGAQLIEIKQAFGKVIEYAHSSEEDADAFKMTSFYYMCAIAPELQGPDYSLEEQALGSQPVWMDLDEAIHANQEVLQANGYSRSSWTPRETYVLEQLKRRFSG